VNRVNLVGFRKSLTRRTAGSLELLLSDDKRFRDPATNADAYAEAWALNYFLLRTRGDAYVKYLASLAEQKPLIDVSPVERIKEFQKFFGDNLTALEDEFLKYMRGVN
jgi:hypothetical protein